MKLKTELSGYKRSDDVHDAGPPRLPDPNKPEFCRATQNLRVQGEIPTLDICSYPTCVVVFGNNQMWHFDCLQFVCRATELSGSRASVKKSAPCGSKVSERKIMYCVRSKERSKSYHRTM